ncbi:MAG: hypothetical protein NC408_09995 [Candidatus Gastranaerophilales bacterium]|nr:hypothetical protein [Candidatus Gastranaerophilales bacterium]
MNIQSVNLINNRYNNKTVNNRANNPFNTVPEQSADTVSFKGKKPPSKTAIFFAEHYGKQFANSDKMQAFCEKLSKLNCGDVTQHLATLGSIITSSVYMQKTLTNDSLDADRRKTLAWNQGLVLGFSTLGAYSLNNVMGGINKELEYKYVALQEHKMAKMGKVDPKKLAEMKEVFSNRLGGFRTLMPILTFTMVYRYISPVAITPVANWVSDKFSAAKKEKEQPVIATEITEKLAENLENKAAESKSAA